MRNAIAVKVLQPLWVVAGLVCLIAPRQAMAQSLAPIDISPSAVIPPQVVNGLFSPTSAERFFEAGRDQIETDARRLLSPPPHESLLTVDPEVLHLPSDLTPEETDFEF